MSKYLYNKIINYNILLWDKKLIYPTTKKLILKFYNINI